MRSKLMAAEIVALLRARNPLIWVVTREEARVEGYLFEAAAAAGYVPRCWDVAAGVTDLGGRPISNMGGTDPGDTLATIAARAQSARERGVWILRDLPAWLDGPLGLTTLRALRNLARMLPGVARENAQAVVVLTPRAAVPEELMGHATVIEWPLPDREEIAAVLDTAIEALPDEYREGANGQRDAAIDAAIGLTGEEAQACYAKSLVQLRRIDPALVNYEKRRVVARERVLEWFDPLPGGLDAVGGLDLLKGWLTTRKLAYSPEARAYGLPKPKGMLLLGHPGTGKSLCARAVATAWGVPLLRLDLGALKSKYIGESEGNLRRALRVVEAIGNCILWLDEVEKAFAGATQGAADGGVSADALAAVLLWMQERKDSGAFIVATANEPSLPPEFMRRGRFDELFFLDLPTHEERVEIIKAALRSNGRGEFAGEWGAIADVTSNFTGAEIAALVPEALFAAFADSKREITLKDLITAARNVVPLSVTASETFQKRRDWAKGRMRFATSEPVEITRNQSRRVDL